MKEFSAPVVVSCIDCIPVYDGDKFVLSPFATDPQFFTWLEEVLEKFNIDLVLTGVEEILFEISMNETFRNKHLKTKFIVEEKSKIEIFQSKLKTCQWLESLGVNHPKYYSPVIHGEIRRDIFKDIQRLLVKPIHGKSSSGIERFRKEDFIFDDVKNDQIVQEYIGSKDSEITVGCFFHNDNVYQCQLKRKLINGHTSHVELIEDSKITEYCEKIIRSLRPEHPVNIQLRLRENGDPVCFEINCRVSGSAPFRHLLGFRDVEALILKINGINIDKCFIGIAPVGTKGIRVLREEVYIENKVMTL
ncbi:ATP-grasp domain-containing protein [bacterium]|nr:ATP-grasp domain-containing protein [bacterium]